MKKYSFYLALILILGLVSCNNSKNEQAPDTKEIADNVIEVLDFHSTHRCMTCTTIEEKTRAMLAESYAKEMKNGVITFQTINVDEESNKELAEEFAAYGTALFLHVIKNGESTQVDLTNFAFMSAMNEDGSFEDGLKTEIEKALQALES